MSKNAFYWNEVEAAIIKLLTEQVPADMAKKVVAGNFQLLPTPADDDFNDFFPAILVAVQGANIDYDNAALKPTTQDYAFKIYYLTTDDGVSTEQGNRKAVRLICNALFEDFTLGDLYIEKSETEIGMQGLGGQIFSLNFESEIMELFYQLQIPVHVSEIDYVYTVKTFRR